MIFVLRLETGKKSLSRVSFFFHFLKLVNIYFIIADNLRKFTYTRYIVCKLVFICVFHMFHTIIWCESSTFEYM